MSSSAYSSSPSSIAKKKTLKRSPKKRVTKRPPSASEIARNQHHFETWVSHQNLEEASWETDIPDDLKADVRGILDTKGKIPLTWIQQDLALPRLATQEFVHWIKQVYEDQPEMFSDRADLDAESEKALYADLVIVLSAWRKLDVIQHSSSTEKWSEADYAANVYSVLRGPAIRASNLRVQCSLCLPEPTIPTISTEASRILSTKSVIPDCVLLLPTPLLAPLTPQYKSLARQTRISPLTTSSTRSTFRYQATPCIALSETPGFEFISSVWEDKQPNWKDGYRQNRMACASVVRHLWALGQVRTVVWGLVWCEGQVRVHVDWAAKGEDGKAIVHSAAYSTVPNEAFKVFDLSRPAHILEIYFLLRNIDQWTTGAFKERVTESVMTLANKKGETFVGWRRSEIAVKSSRKAKENATSVCSTEVKKARK
ncbi:hypothetical protein WG66_015155 [Moniliophthora roreri]|uniref:Uncharacterized protein n=1 Tax=Moniliophthora roreri TaxID=221103 RepID=A0A0W0FGG7_MONRR|nr:hypothetical protein WG66_015155 [Moniliophthora roreri]